VSIADFINLASNFGKTNAGWSQGDLNYDGQVTVSDFIDLAANFGRSFVQPAVSAALGETVGASGNSTTAFAVDEQVGGASIKRWAGRAVHSKVASHGHRHHRRAQQRMSWRWRGNME
jgi:hypothetical protein